jgi:hypothetical protein
MQPQTRTLEDGRCEQLQPNFGVQEHRGQSSIVYNLTAVWAEYVTVWAAAASSLSMKRNVFSTLPHEIAITHLSVSYRSPGVAKLQEILWFACWS